MNNAVLIGIFLLVQGVGYLALSIMRARDDEPLGLTILMFVSSLVFLVGGVLTLTGGWE